MLGQENCGVVGIPSSAPDLGCLMVMVEQILGVDAKIGVLMRSDTSDIRFPLIRGFSFASAAWSGSLGHETPFQSIGCIRTSVEHPI